MTNLIYQVSGGMHVGLQRCQLKAPTLHWGKEQCQDQCCAVGSWVRGPAALLWPLGLSPGLASPGVAVPLASPHSKGV